MQRIELSQGLFAIIDDEDYASMSNYNWYFDGRSYAVRSVTVNGKRVKIWMHREILGVSCEVDHINGDGLDNRKCNLRPASHMENMRNRKPNTVSTSKYRGVYWHKQAKKWRARLRTQGLHLSLGLFENEVSAAVAYDNAALRVFGEFARLNFTKE